MFVAADNSSTDRRADHAVGSVPAEGGGEGGGQNTCMRAGIRGNERGGRRRREWQEAEGVAAAKLVCNDASHSGCHGTFRTWELAHFPGYAPLRRLSSTSKYVSEVKVDHELGKVPVETRAYDTNPSMERGHGPGASIQVQDDMSWMT